VFTTKAEQEEEAQAEAIFSRTRRTESEEKQNKIERTLKFQVFVLRPKI
jgi:hypothetical protein